MNLNSLKLAKLYFETWDMYYTALESQTKTYIDYENNLVSYIKCFFCSERAEIQHFTPPLKLFNKFIDEQNLEALAKLKYNVVPSCMRCSQLLDNSNALTLDDQLALIRSTANGTFRQKNAGN